MWLHYNMKGELYLLITKDNCPNCEKAKIMLDNENISYISMDSKDVLSDFIEMVKGKDVTKYPFVFKLVGGVKELGEELSLIQ